jgi:hypothetical protein
MCGDAECEGDGRCWEGVREVPKSREAIGVWRRRGREKGLGWTWDRANFACWSRLGWRDFHDRRDGRYMERFRFRDGSEEIPYCKRNGIGNITMHRSLEGRRFGSKKSNGAGWKTWEHGNTQEHTLSSHPLSMFSKPTQSYALPKSWDGDRSQRFLAARLHRPDWRTFRVTVTPRSLSEPCPCRQAIPAARHRRYFLRRFKSRHHFRSNCFPR